jgi:hypothetical protein
MSSKLEASSWTAAGGAGGLMLDLTPDFSVTLRVSCGGSERGVQSLTKQPGSRDHGRSGSRSAHSIQRGTT